MLGGEKEQILTQKQLFREKGKLFCFILDFCSDSTNMLFSQDFLISGKKNLVLPHFLLLWLWFFSLPPEEGLRLISFRKAF